MDKLLKDIEEKDEKIEELESKVAEIENEWAKHYQTLKIPNSALSSSIPGIPFSALSPFPLTDYRLFTSFFLSRSLSSFNIS